MLIPYSSTEQQWSVSWMNGRKQPLSKPRITAWETAETLESGIIWEQHKWPLPAKGMRFTISRELWRLPVDLVRQFDCCDSEAEDCMGGGVQRQTTQAGKKLT